MQLLYVTSLSLILQELSLENKNWTTNTEDISKQPESELLLEKNLETC